MTTLRRRPLAVAVVFTGALVLILAAILLTAPPAWAQVLYGGMVGNVTDPQGAVLPGVTVTITNVGTGLKLETVTDDTGNYVFRNLLPGTYDMTVSLAGFTTLRQTDIVVQAGTPRRQDAKLALGPQAKLPAAGRKTVRRGRKPRRPAP